MCIIELLVKSVALMVPPAVRHGCAGIDIAAMAGR